MVWFNSDYGEACCCFESFLFHLISFHSGCSHSGQSCGADPYEAAGSETVVQGADQLHPFGSADRGLALFVAGLGTDALKGRAFLGHVLVQLWEMQKQAVWTLPHQRAYICYLLHIWSCVRCCKCYCPWYMRILFKFSENTKLTSNVYSNSESSNYLYPYFRLHPLLRYHLMSSKPGDRWNWESYRQKIVILKLTLLFLLIIQLLSGVSLHVT